MDALAIFCIRKQALHVAGEAEHALDTKSKMFLFNALQNSRIIFITKYNIIHLHLPSPHVKLHCTYKRGKITKIPRLSLRLFHVKICT